jgi:hypothetical protein
MTRRGLEMLRPPPGTALAPEGREWIHTADRDTCSASLMSATKWWKLISALEAVSSIDHYFWESICHPIELSDFGYLSANAPHEFIDTLSRAPIYLREIKWQEFRI